MKKSFYLLFCLLVLGCNNAEKKRSELNGVTELNIQNSLNIQYAENCVISIPYELIGKDNPSLQDCDILKIVHEKKMTFSFLEKINQLIKDDYKYPLKPPIYWIQGPINLLVDMKNAQLRLIVHEQEIFKGCAISIEANETVGKEYLLKKSFKPYSIMPSDTSWMLLGFGEYDVVIYSDMLNMEDILLGVSRYKLKIILDHNMFNMLVQNLYMDETMLILYN